MASKGRLVAGSHNRNEFVLINADDIGRVTSVKELSGQNCQICGDEIEVCGDEVEPFVACNECAFPVCRPCYEYERREGNQACPQCKTRYKRLKGSPRVEGDDDEDDIDDLENELEYACKFMNPNDPQQIAETVLASRLNVVPAPSSASGFTTPTEFDLVTTPAESVSIYWLLSRAWRSRTL